MNHLTKEELEDLQLIYKTFVIDDDGVRRKLTNLESGILKKIQSMIDNYCEHEWQKDLYHLDIYLCVNCGKRVWWENK